MATGFFVPLITLLVTKLGVSNAVVLFINEHKYNRDFMTEAEAEAFTRELEKS